MGTSEFCSHDDDAIGEEACSWVFLSVGAFGAGLGTLVGHFIRTEGWTEVPVESLRISVTPDARGGMRVVVSF